MNDIFGFEELNSLKRRAELEKKTREEHECIQEDCICVKWREELIQLKRKEKQYGL